MKKQKEELAMPLVLDRNIDPLYKEGINDGISQGISQGITQGISQGVNQVFQNIVQIIKITLKSKFHGKEEVLYPLIEKIDKMDNLIKLQ